MLAWLHDLTTRERRTMTACWAGWTLDGFDGQLYSYIVPTVIAAWGMTAGAVLMGEVIRDKYRGRGVGFVQTGAAFGPGAAALVYAGLFAVLPESIAWRALFAIGILPALLVLWIRRNIDESDSFRGKTEIAAGSGVTQLLAAFRGPYMWTTINATLMIAGAQGGVFAVQFWMPTYLRTVRGLSASSAGMFVFVQMVGALIGFLIGAYLSDIIGRKWTFFISAFSTAALVMVFMFVPMGDTTILIMGVPLSAAILMKFAPMGPFLTELYPTAVRGTGQGFCYNGGRGVGSFFPTIIGFAAARMALGPAVAIFCVLSCCLMCVMLLFLPETHGRQIANLESGLALPGD